jgi:hypothetical protein
MQVPSFLSGQVIALPSEHPCSKCWSLLQMRPASCDGTNARFDEGCGGSSDEKVAIRAQPQSAGRVVASCKALRNTWHAYEQCSDLLMGSRCRPKLGSRATYVSNLEVDGYGPLCGWRLPSRWFCQSFCFHLFLWLIILWFNDDRRTYQLHKARYALR